MQSGTPYPALSIVQCDIRGDSVRGSPVATHSEAVSVLPTRSAETGARWRQRPVSERHSNHVRPVRGPASPASPVCEHHPARPDSTRRARRLRPFAATRVGRAAPVAELWTCGADAGQTHAARREIRRTSQTHTFSLVLGAQQNTGDHPIDDPRVPDAAQPFALGVSITINQLVVADEVRSTSATSAQQQTMISE